MGMSNPADRVLAQRQRDERVRWLRRLHNAIGLGELLCLGHLWWCAVTRRRDPGLQISVVVLATEGIALVAAKGCPFGILQRRAGDDVPMFELWFGRRLAPYGIPVFTALAVLGYGLLLIRKPGRGFERSERSGQK
jgi:hypothetical protein